MTVKTGEIQIIHIKNEHIITRYAYLGIRPPYDQTDINY